MPPAYRPIGPRRSPPTPPQSAQPPTIRNVREYMLCKSGNKAPGLQSRTTAEGPLHPPACATCPAPRPFPHPRNCRASPPPNTSLIARARRHAFRALRMDSQNRPPRLPRPCRSAAARPPAGRPCARNRVRQPLNGATRRRLAERHAFLRGRSGDGEWVTTAASDGGVPVFIPVSGSTHAHVHASGVCWNQHRPCRSASVTPRYRRTRERLRSVSTRRRPR